MSPAEKVETPKQERRPRNRLRRDEYDRLLSLAGSHPRDFAILTVFLQCGLRVSELCSLTVSDIDLTARTLAVQDGKGQVARSIALEAKAIKALKTYLTARGEPLSPALFLTRYGEPVRGKPRERVMNRKVAGEKVPFPAGVGTLWGDSGVVSAFFAEKPMSNEAKCRCQN